MYRRYNPYYFKKLDERNISEASAQIKDFRTYLEDHKELDNQLNEIYPLDTFGNEEDALSIKGSKSLLEAFNIIHAEKMDIISKLDDIEYIGLSSNNEIILRFTDDDLNATGIYSFTYDFFEVLFKMGKFSTHCISNGFNDLLNDTLNELIKLQKDDEKQYRFLWYNDELCLRGITSLGYNNYDNNIVLYLTLLFLDKYFKENNISYIINEAEVSDSHLRIVMKDETSLEIADVGTVQFGLVFKNDEIREGAFSLEIKYSLYDENGNYVFAGIPGLKDSIFEVIHTNGINTLAEKLSRINNILTLQHSMIPLIAGLKHAGNINDVTIEFLFEKIFYARKALKTSTRKNILGLFDANVINNTISLIEAFGRISEIDCDFDESLFVQSLYHKVLKRVIR